VGGLTRATRIEETAMATSLARKLLCRVVRWHDWHTFTTDDGSRYVACRACGRDHPGSALGANTIGA
jgi:hypothetical protein